MPPKKKVSNDSDLFDGKVFTLSGTFHCDQKTLKEKITSNGGIVASSVTKAVTHLISTQEDFDANSSKQQAAKKQGIPVLNDDWIHTSVARGALQKEEDFMFQAAKEDDKKGDGKEEKEAGTKRKSEAAEDEPAPKRGRGKKKKEEEDKKEDKDQPDDAAENAPRRSTRRGASSAEDSTDTSSSTVTTAAVAPAATVAAPAAASPPPTLKKVVAKGRAAVDEYSGHSSDGHVYDDGTTVWDCMLNQVNIGQNNNKFYKIQLIQSDNNPNSFWFWTRWGRVGEVGQSALQPVNSAARGFSAFEKKFKDKTGNSWDNRANFQRKTGKYTLIEIDYGAADEEDDNLEVAATRSFPGSKLDPRIQDVIKMIFDLKTMEKTLTEMEFDIKKMPLGKLSKKQIQEGYQTLKSIEKELENSRPNSTELQRLSSDFYTLIPHAYGRGTVPPVIRTVEMLKMKMQMLEALADIEIATKIIKESNKGTMNPVDSNYEKLKCELVPVERHTQEFKTIKTYVDNSQEPGSSRGRVELVELFKSARQGEAERFKNWEKVGDRRLLWHGSRVTNYGGILSQGLRIAPPEAPKTGYLFGKGMYFADLASLSQIYCRVSPSEPYGIMLLCDVALGKLYECPRDEYMEKPKNGAHSTWALGTVEPDPAGNITSPDGYVIPAGPVKPSKHTGVSCREHQYICYDEGQSQIKYLLKMKWNFN